MAEQRSYTGSFTNRWKFTGKELDEETGLYYFGARFYNPVTSLWLSVDPLVEKTMDAYGYCYNNPINLIDPTGMSPEGGGEGGEQNDPPKKPSKFEQAMAEFFVNLALKAGELGAATKGVEANTIEEKLSHSTDGMLWVYEESLFLYGVNQMNRAPSKGEFKPNYKKNTSLNIPKNNTTSSRANEILSLVPVETQKRTTIAVADAVKNGKNLRIIASSEKRLRRSQREGLKMYTEVEATGEGHAEVTIINYAKEHGMNLINISASRPICTDCAKAINNAGVSIGSPLKKIKKK